MKKEIHPEYNYIVFRDEGADFQFLTRSTLKTDKTIKWEDGNEYPLYTMDISSASHPFYTGKRKLIDAAGRIDKFNRRYSK
jgi:large subunit ribosomal protein L31